MAAQRKRQDDHHHSGGAGNDAGAPLDGEELRKALGEAHAAAGTWTGGPASDARGLRDRAEAALSGTEAEPPLVGNEAEAVLVRAPAWSLRRQVLFIAFASALCWTAVLAPLALVF